MGMHASKKLGAFPSFIVRVVSWDGRGITCNACIGLDYLLILGMNEWVGG
jgi:hypothetical protein